MAAGGGFDAGSIYSRLFLDLKDWQRAKQQVATDQAAMRSSTAQTSQAVKELAQSLASVARTGSPSIVSQTATLKAVEAVQGLNREMKSAAASAQTFNAVMDRQEAVLRRLAAAETARAAAAKLSYIQRFQPGYNDGGYSASKSGANYGSMLRDAIGDTEADLQGRVKQLTLLQSTVQRGSFDWQRLEEQITLTNNSLRGFDMQANKVRESMMVAGTVGMHFAMVFGAIGAASLVATHKMLEVAGAAQETQNLFEISMGAMGSAASGWVDEMNTALGVSRTSLRQTVGTFNVMLDSMGLTEKQAYDMSTALSTLTYDLSSFYNISFDEAFAKLSSGLAGEIEPLKRLGVLVNDNAVKQWALANGLTRAGEEMTDQQKVVARYNLIMEQTGKAQGDMVRTLGSYTNQSRIAGEVSGALAKALGDSLLPTATWLIHAFNRVVVALDEFAQAHPALTAGMAATAAAAGILMPLMAGMALLYPGLLAYTTAMGVALGALAIKVGLITGGVTLALGALAAFIYKQGEGERQAAKLAAEWHKGYESLTKLETRYNSLQAIYARTKTPTNELKDATSQLKDSYKDLGFVVDETSGKFGKMSESVARARLAQLKLAEEEMSRQISKHKSNMAVSGTVSGLPFSGGFTAGIQKDAADKFFGDLGKLRDEIAALEESLTPAAQAAMKMADAQERLRGMGIETTAYIKGQIAVLEELRGTLQGDAHDYEVLTKAIEAWKAKLVVAQQAESDAVSDAMKDLIGTTGQELQAKIAAINAALRDERMPYNIRRLNEELKKAQDELAGINDKVKTLQDYIVTSAEYAAEMAKLEGMLAELSPDSHDWIALSEVIKKLRDDFEAVGRAEVPKLELGNRDLSVRSLLGEDFGIGKMRDVLDKLREYQQLTAKGSEDWNAIQYSIDQVTESIDRLKGRSLRELIGPTSDDLRRDLADANMRIAEAFNPRDMARLKDVIYDLNVELGNVSPLMRAIKESGQDAANSLQDSFSDFFMDLSSGTVSATEAFKNFAVSILRELQQILAKMVAVKMMMAIGFSQDAGGNWSSGWLSAIMSGIGGYFGGGGGGSVPKLNYTPTALATGTNFVPATGLYTLHRGEEVVPAEYNPNAGGGKGGDVVIYNLITPEAVAATMGDRVVRGAIINVIDQDSLANGRTRRAIRRN